MCKKGFIRGGMNSNPRVFSSLFLPVFLLQVLKFGVVHVKSEHFIFFIFPIKLFSILECLGLKREPSFLPLSYKCLALL